MDKLENLKKLKQLLDDGVLSEKEYSEMKNEILSKTDDDVKSSLETPITENKKNKTGTLTVGFKGQWFLFDAKTQLFVNNVLHSTHSTKQGFSVQIPISSESISIKVVLMSIKSTVYELEELDKSKDYSLGLIYDSAWGKYSNKFNIVENG
ncbi:SHOCT domain-containing protein [Flavobacterium glaciei]|uniref:Oligomerization/nucleic acid binding protein n=1 Tax=Flavobacterium glaciei TaxID=386300 RepID=A0A562PJU0_9FLAO|nr:SHOCT domain-containing protein [Flavobacterium glaciei]RDI50479.1 putative oligomerization/nucleic acid binding protein [Flavobacterium glaciei]TWI44732.1 putative oligomerization/nucleic acid binding protein [Flavobacterium glaciei]